jgi:hypothetical protein
MFNLKFIVMKKEKITEKLVFKKETIARLNNLEMGVILGGDDDTGTHSNNNEACTNGITTVTQITRVGKTCPHGLCQD